MVCVAVAIGCGPVAGEETTDSATSGEPDPPPSECDEAPYDAACEAAFARRCEMRTDEEMCLETPSLPGGLSLQCAWIEPQTVVDLQTCALSPAAPRCVGVAFPGDIGCSTFLEDDGEVLVIIPDACFPIGWGECSDDDAPAQCSCVEF